MNACSTKWFLLISLLNLFQDNNGQYVPPTPTVEPLSPRGLRMSIPDEPGITLVAYHVKFNEDFDGLEAGTIARDIVKVRNGRWTYQDRSTRLKKGDVIYYWIHVVFDGLGYNLLDQQHVVDEFYSYDATPVNQLPTTETISPAGCNKISETRVYEINQKRQQFKLHNVCSKQLIFEENFDTLNTTRWSVLQRFSDAPSYEFVVYMNIRETVEVKDGVLHIKPVLSESKYGDEFVNTGTLTLDRCTGKVGTSECTRTAIGSNILPPVITGRLNTKNSFAFLYGRVQVRAKLPRGDWIYPIITLESIENGTENSATFYNIIIGYSAGNAELTTVNRQDISGRVLYAGAHAVNVSQSVQYSNHLTIPSNSINSLWSDDYHLYELMWTNGRLTATVDGTSFGEQTVPALYNKPVSINVGLGVGGHIFFPDGCRSNTYTKPWRNIESKALYNFHCAKDNWYETWQQSDTDLRIDFIKVWAN